MLKSLVAFLLLVPLVTSTFISMTTTVDVSVDGEEALVSVDVQNNGDESAYNVQLTADLKGIKNASEIKNSLGVKQSFQSDLSLDLSSLEKSGNYPLIIRVDYADANGYPFSAITPSAVSYRESTSSDVFATLGESTMSEGGETSVRVKLKNLGDESGSVKVYLVTPKELSVEGEKNIELQGKSEQEVSFQIKSFGALAGSTYVVLAVVEYEDELHYSSVARGTVKIEKAGNILLDNWFLIVVLMVLVGIVLLFQFKGLRWSLWRKKPSSLVP